MLGPSAAYEAACERIPGYRERSEINMLRMSPYAYAALMEGVIKFLNAGAFFVPAQVGVAEGSYAVMFVVFALISISFWFMAIPLSSRSRRASR